MAVFPARQRIACCAALRPKATTSEISAPNSATATVPASPAIPHCRSVRSHFTRGPRHEMRPLPQIIGTNQPQLLGDAILLAYVPSSVPAPPQSRDTEKDKRESPC